MNKLLALISLLIVPNIGFSGNIFESLKSSKNLQSIDWNYPEKSFLNKMRNDVNQSYPDRMIMKQEKNTLFAGIDFNYTSLFKFNSEKQYQLIFKVDSSDKDICKKGNNALEKLYGKNFIYNDRTSMIKDIRTQWVIGNSMITSMCFGSTDKYWSDNSTLLYSVLFSGLDGFGKEIPLQIVNCKVDIEFADIPRKEYFNLIFKIDETRKTLIDNRDNRIWANNLLFSDSSIEFKRDNSTDAYISTPVFKIDRYTGRVTGSDEIIQKNNKSGMFHVPNYKINYFGECKKIDTLEKKF